jgi:hypothetical protein
MARAPGFDFREDLESTGIREAAVCADRREPKPSNPEPATSSTKIAPGTPTRTQPVPELFPKVVLSKVPPHQRPFPITLFLRYNRTIFNQIILERVETARVSTYPPPAKPPAAELSLGTGGKQTTT